MYQIIERLIMQSPFLMGLIVLIGIFMYLKFIFSSFNDSKEVDIKEVDIKTRLLRLILILSSPLVVWFIIILNSNSLDVFDSKDKSPEQIEYENNLRVYKMLDSMSKKDSYRIADSSKLYGIEEIEKGEDTLNFH
jgi:hypothetical protein